MFRNWLPRTLTRTIKPLREGHRGAGPRPSSRLKLEALEDRLAPATHIWVGPAVGGLWSVAANWNGGAPTSGEAGGTIVQFNGGIDSIDDIVGLVVGQIHFTADANTIRGLTPLGIDGSSVANSLVNDAGSSTLDATLPLALSGGNFVALVSAGQVTIAGSISGNEGLTLAAGSDAGTLVLGGVSANTYTGTTTVQDGTLVLNKPAGVNAVGGNVTVGNGIGVLLSDVLQLAASNQIPDTATITVQSDGFFDLFDNSEAIAALNITGGRVDSGGGTLTLQGTVTATSDAAGDAASILGNFALGTGAGNFVVTDGPVAGTNDLVLAASITGSTGLTLTAASTGQMVISAPDNAYTGGTTVLGGTLLLGASNALPVPPQVAADQALTVTAPATLDLNGFDQELASISGTGTITDTGVQATLTVNNAAAHTFGGLLAGNLALTKINTGTLTLTANNTYSGPTTINAGSLLINGAQPNSTVFAFAPGTLGGTGTTGPVNAGIDSPATAGGTVS